MIELLLVLLLISIWIIALGARQIATKIIGSLTAVYLEAMYNRTITDQIAGNVHKLAHPGGAVEVSP